MLKRLTGKRVRSHRELANRRASLPLCYYECLYPCMVIEPERDLFSVNAAEKMIF